MGIQSLNDIVNDYSSLRNTNVNDNVERNRKPDEIARADRIADYVCRKIGDNGARRYYCKAAYYLSEDQIYRCLDLALKGRCPVKYMSWLLKRELEQRRTNASGG